MHFYEEDKSIMGGEFITMNRVDGRIPSDDPPFTATGWVLEELSPEQRATMCQNALEALAKIHAADWKGLGLDELVDGDYAQAGIDAQLDHWEHTFNWAAEGEPNPTVEAAIEWCRANRPADEGPQVLVWGDARVGNMIFADDLSIGAVLDWEMVTVANPELDLAWWLFMVRHHTEGIGAPLPEGFPTREETIANYETLTGYTAKDIDYYEVFSALRLSILMHRAGNMMIAAGLLPEDAPMKLSNPASMLLAKMLELPAPGSEVQSFIGNR
jgi:aminoglycoside phosphotransferase (APT) family kinase protein